VPPRIVEKASGINSREVFTPERFARPDIAGSSTAADAMLFIKSERNAPAIITTIVRRSSPLPPTFKRMLPTCSVTPVRCSDSVSTKIEMITITAERLKPENASCGERTPVSPSATTTSSATRSAASLPLRNSTSATPRITQVMIR